MIPVSSFKRLIPLACDWAREQESIILREGVPLTPEQVADAERVGVNHPERVRLLSVHAVPPEETPLLRVAADQLGLFTPPSIGLALGYGIFVRTDHWKDRRLLVHELTHTAQCERLGGVERFLAAYIDECIAVRYPNGSLEMEARLMQQRIVGLK